jgi:polysaccharide biosynthesis protein PslF
MHTMTKPTVIAHISIYPPKGEKHSKSGGVASYTKNLVNAIPLEYIENHVFGEIINNQTSYIEEGVSVHRVFHRDPRFVFELLKKIRTIKPDTIHIQQELGLYGNMVTAFLLQFLILFAPVKKKVITLHGVVSPKQINQKFVQENNSKLPAFLVKIAFYCIFKPLTKYADTIVVHEDIFKNVLITDYKVDETKIQVIPHGVEELHLDDKNYSRQLLNIAQGTTVFLFMGYLTGYKGLDLLVEGFADYTKKTPNTLLIIGAGKHPKLANDTEYLKKQYNRLQNKATTMIPRENCRWVGFVEEYDIKKYYSVADAIVFPYTISMSSSGPMALAIGYGVPILASDVFRGVLADEFLFAKNSHALSIKMSNFDTKKSLLIAEKIKLARQWNMLGKQYHDLYTK